MFTFPDFADGLVPVTLVERTSGDPTAVSAALRRTVSTREAEASGGDYTASDVVWHLPASELPAPPTVGDRIVEASGATWTILRVQQMTQDSRWRCIARELRIADHEATLVEIEVATWTKGDAGAATASWSTEQSDVRAAIQPERVEVRIENGRRTVESTHRVYLEQSLTLTENHRLVGPDATIYQVLRTEKSDRLDAAMVVAVRAEN